MTLRVRSARVSGCFTRSQAKRIRLVERGWRSGGAAGAEPGGSLYIGMIRRRIVRHFVRAFAQAGEDPPLIIVRIS